MTRTSPLACLLACVALGCSGPGSAGSEPTASPQSAPAEAAATAKPKIETFAEGLVHPWALAFLPDGRMLVTERPGRLRYVDPGGALSSPIAGLPAVFAQGQGGLLDLVLDPDFASNRLIYVSYAEPGEGGTAGTAVARGRLDGERVTGVEVIFRQQPKIADSKHFGSRLAFAPDGNLFVTLGDRFQFDPAQDRSNSVGTVVRIRPDGSVPADNPFAGQAQADAQIWSYGHRNIEAAAINPATNALWIAEMGPRGGDELNVPQAGRNHGWPLVSWGEHYDGEAIPDPSTRPEFADAVRHWTPVISPSGMIFYGGDLFPGWRGNALIGGLSAQGLVRLVTDGDRVTGEHRIAIGRRIRDVAEGPDGAVYVVTDESRGKVLKLTPAR